MIPIHFSLGVCGASTLCSGGCLVVRIKKNISNAQISQLKEKTLIGIRQNQAI